MACTRNKFFYIFDLGLNFYTVALQNYLKTVKARAPNLAQQQTKNCAYLRM